MSKTRTFSPQRWSLSISEAYTRFRSLRPYSYIRINGDKCIYCYL